MALGYRFLVEAKQELVDAAAYHEQQREGLGLKLFDDYDAVIEHAVDFPDAGKRVDLGSDFEVRCFQTRSSQHSCSASSWSSAFLTTSADPATGPRDSRRWSASLAVSRVASKGSCSISGVQCQADRDAALGGGLVP